MINVRLVLAVVLVRVWRGGSSRDQPTRGGSGTQPLPVRQRALQPGTAPSAGISRHPGELLPKRRKLRRAQLGALRRYGSALDVAWPALRGPDHLGSHRPHDQVSRPEKVPPTSCRRHCQDQSAGRRDPVSLKPHGRRRNTGEVAAGGAGAVGGGALAESAGAVVGAGSAEGRGEEVTDPTAATGPAAPRPAPTTAAATPPSSSCAWSCSGNDAACRLTPVSARHPLRNQAPVNAAPRCPVVTVVHGAGAPVRAG